MDDILKLLVGNQATQAFLVMVAGQLMKAVASWLQTNKPPDERGKGILGIVIVLLSLVMSFLQQYSDGTLNAFDPAPWQNFIVVVAASVGLLKGAEKGAEKVQAILKKGK